MFEEPCDVASRLYVSFAIYGLTENAGVENAAPSSGAYSEFEVRWCEAKESLGRKFPSEVQEQSSGMESGGRPQKAQAQALNFTSTVV